MKIKKGLILFIHFFIILLISHVSNISRVDSLNIPLSSHNDNIVLTLNSLDATNATVISDIYGWNDGSSEHPSVAVDGSDNVHVVWEDDTAGEWGNDYEIMYANYTAAGWSNATAISDIYGWNDGSSEDPSVAVDNNSNVHVVWSDATAGEWGNDYEIMYANYTAAGWSNATAISDLYGWNVDDSVDPSIALDGNNNIHVVWSDTTNGEWGIDEEIMYANYTAAGWSNASCISDVYGWNNGISYYPSVAVDGNDNIHVVWSDATAGEWGNDYEIMYANYTAAGWSNATAISDLYGWNNGGSYYPSIAINGDENVHVVWNDITNGEWGTDFEIMYVNYTAADWSNATVISDDATGWNDGISSVPIIAVDNNDNFHVVWQDRTVGEWGFDWEIMYANYTAAGWSNATVISDDATGWNDDTSNWPSIAVDGSGNVHTVWHDYTDGEWGTDTEIMHVVITEKPTSNHPADIHTTISGSETIDWVIRDSYGEGQYRVLIRHIYYDKYYLHIDWTPWTNNTIINIPINRSAWGIFIYTIEYYDFHHHFGISDSVIVEIKDNVPEEPIIIAPQSGDFISWLLSPLGLGIIGAIIALNMLITILISKKLSKTLK